MIPNSIENTIIKYLSKEASFSEMEILETWLQDSENENLFREYVKLNYLIDINTKHFDKTKLLEELSRIMSEEKKSNLFIRTRSLMRYAAVLILFISSIWIYDNLNDSSQLKSDSAINEVVLKSENGLVKVLNQKGKSQIKGRNGKVLFQKIDNTLEYNVNESTEKLVYNTLTVPYGRRFSVKLSDGTNIQLNAGTSLRFPVKFIEGQDRKVFIEYGEAYFDVSKDAKHPFVVNNNNIDIKVLGTQFNVSAYPEDGNMSTILVEGSVQLNENSDGNNTILLEPGYQAVWSNSEDNFEITKADVDMHTSWRYGKIVLKSLHFNQMIKKLQRHYDVEITCNDDQLNREIITTTFEQESIDEVLKLINEIHPIDYVIEGRKISIYKKEN